MKNLRRTSLQRARRVPGAIALATALTVLAAPLAAIEHEANVRHIVCLEHGELIDAAPLSAAAIAAPAHHHHRAVVERSSREPASADDVHCLVAGWSHERSTAAQNPLASASASPSTKPSLASVPDRRPSAIALYQLAPKLSPPSV